MKSLLQLPPLHRAVLYAPFYSFYIFYAHNFYDYLPLSLTSLCNVLELRKKRKKKKKGGRRKKKRKEKRGEEEGRRRKREEVSTA